MCFNLNSHIHHPPRNLSRRKWSLGRNVFLQVAHVASTLNNQWAKFAIAISHQQWEDTFSLLWVTFILIAMKSEFIYNVSPRSAVQQRDPITHIALGSTIGSHCPSIPDTTKKPKGPPITLQALSPLGTPKSALLVHHVSASCFFVSFWYFDRIICSIFQFPHIRDIIQYLSSSFWITSLSMSL